MKVTFKSLIVLILLTACAPTVYYLEEPIGYQSDYEVFFDAVVEIVSTTYFTGIVGQRTYMNIEKMERQSGLIVLSYDAGGSIERANILIGKQSNETTTFFYNTTDSGFTLASGSTTFAVFMPIIIEKLDQRFSRL